MSPAEFVRRVFAAREVLTDLESGALTTAIVTRARGELQALMAEARPADGAEVAATYVERLEQVEQTVANIAATDRAWKPANGIWRQT